MSPGTFLGWISRPPVSAQIQVSVRCRRRPTWRSAGGRRGQLAHLSFSVVDSAQGVGGSERTIGDGVGGDCPQGARCCAGNRSERVDHRPVRGGQSLGAGSGVVQNPPGSHGSEIPVIVQRALELLQLWIGAMPSAHSAATIVELAEYHHNVPLTRGSLHPHRLPVSARRSASRS